MVRKALFSGATSFFVWVLLSQTGAEYSAVEKNSACVDMRRVLAAAPHWVPTGGGRATRRK